LRARGRNHHPSHLLLPLFRRIRRALPLIPRKEIALGWISTSLATADLLPFVSSFFLKSHARAAIR
jgi:hypothetical protein